ncbi:hypothetical protein C8J57DRAFT_1669033 [Mycena rebaudengoi]|nr:hypothetical protein C8J57DRAFT_1669033 [Mycena rebaudengoi]
MEYQSASELAGVVCLGVAALISALAVLFYFMKPSFRLKNYENTHINGYFNALLLANALQAIGTAMNLKWAADGGVTAGGLCTAQGGIKQAGNIATALWSFMISLHLFNLLFLRLKSTRLGFWCSMVLGWGIVFIIVLVGPTVIQRPDKGPYFGISGAWCWITSKYPREQIFLEYFLEYVSAGFCLVLYTIVILRMRGNLVHQHGKWSLRILPKDESWQLSLRRDLIDYSMLQAAEKMVWYPVIGLHDDAFPHNNSAPLPICRRKRAFRNHYRRLPSSSTPPALSTSVLFITIRKLFPDAHELPSFATNRTTMRKSLFVRGGVTPFTVDHSDAAEQFRVERLARAESSANSSRRSSLNSASGSSDAKAKEAQVSWDFPMRRHIPYPQCQCTGFRSGS